MENHSTSFMEPGTGRMAVWLLVLLIAASTVKIVHGAYFTPLFAIPGPWFAKFTSLPLKFHIIRGRRVQFIHSLHQIHGPVVRIAPNEVDVTDLQGYHAIHKIGNGLCKSQWYPRFRTAFEEQDVFSETNMRNHGIRRKLLSRPFSKSNLKQSWEPLVNDKARFAVQRIKELADAGTCNVFDWWNFMATDIIGKVAFGESFGMLEQGKKSEFIQMFEKFAPIGILRSELPTIYRMICLAPKRIFDINETEKIIIRNGKEILARARTGSIDRTNIFTSHLEADESRTNSISKESMVVEATGLVGAGGGTTSVTLTYLVWAVLQQPLVQKKLEEEVATLPDDFAASDLEALPYLNAVLEETLRLHGPIPGALPRVIPASGLSIAGYFIPQGSTVCTQAYSMHRQPEIFPDPERFDPERFLQKVYALQEQRSAFAAFGAGARVCLGMHLAYMELRMATALFFRECAGAGLSLSSPDDMDMMNFFGGFPKGNSCCITLMKG